MRLLHLARLSQDRGSSQTGIESSDIACATWAAGNGHVIIHTAADRKSGTIQPWDRPNARPWVTEPDKIAQYDGVVAHRLDRLSRGDDASTSDIQAWAREHGKVLMTEDGLVYPCEGAEGIRWDVTKRIAHEEWLKTSERYRRMQSHLRSNNYVVGRPCYGYRIVPSGDHKGIAPDPVTGPIVREMIDHYIAGGSLMDTCRWLDARGVKTIKGGKWSPATLKTLFHNETLIGRQKDTKGRTVLRCDPLVSREKWDQLQAHMARRAGRTGIAPGQTAMLTSVAVCSRCGGPMYRVNKAYYRCHGTDTAPSTCKLMVRMDKLEEHVSLLIWGMFARVPVTETVVIAGEGYGEEIADVERDLRELDFDAPDYASRHASLMARRAELKSLPSRPARVEIRDTGRTWGSDWSRLAEQDKRAWLMERGITIKVEKDITGSRILQHGKVLARQSDAA